MQNYARFSKYDGKGQTGLANVGNTCYLNSLIQCLSHTYEFNDFLEKGSYSTRLNKKPDSVLLVEWDSLRKMMWAQNCNIAPWGFVKAVHKVAGLKNQDLFTGYGQQDVQEFLLFLIDCFHNSISREVEMKITGDVKNSKDIMASECYKMMVNMFQNDYSEIVGMFYGIHVSAITSIDDGKSLSVTSEPYFVLSLPMPNTDGTSVTIIECIDEFCKKERLEKENAWYNEDEDIKQDVDKGMVFWSFPDILIIHLKRWNMMGNKDKRNIEAQVNGLDLRKYVKGYNANSYIYNLYGVCNHSGGSFGGHYTANVKTSDGIWYNFNDMSVTKITEDRAVTPEAYCLFYRKIK